jgi:peptidoglycan hydrolase-like protein with peptidoglycan-binding domain
VVGLAQGAIGPDVASVQRALISAGVPLAGGADGRYGAVTAAAVSKFQTAKRLPATGQVDAATAAALGLAVPATNAGSGYVGLANGASGPLVKELQQALAAAGVYVAGGADGAFGAATSKAVSDFQSWNGLEVTGTVTDKTAAALKLGSPGPAASPSPTPTASSSPWVGL